MIEHIALQVDDEKEAEKFYSGILGIPKQREFDLPSSLAKEIFGKDRSIKVLVFSDNIITFEVFVAGKPPFLYAHTCLKVSSRKELINRCGASGIHPNIVMKDDRELVFIHDFAGNLFEIK